MPGGRSLGCKTCKKRKIKCDERRPICTQCEKSGRFCTGALTPFIYEAEMAKAEVAEVSPQNYQSARRRIRWRPVVEAGSRSQTPYAKAQVRSSQSPDSELSSPAACAVSPSASESLAVRVVKVLESTARTGHDIIVLGEWLPEMVSRIGFNPALDAAIEALLLAHEKLVSKGVRNEIAISQVYGRALHALNAELYTGREDISTDTICAALALCDVEILSNRDEEHPAWLSHAGGSAALFQACGPDRFKTRFEKSLLYFHAPQYIGSSLMTGTVSFLESPEWTSLFEEDCEYLGPWDQLQARLVPVYATLPTLLRDINSQPFSSANANQLLVRALDFRGRLLQLEPIAQAVLNSADLVEQISSTSPDSPYRTCYRYSSLLVAQPLWLYWRILIIINNTIRQLAMKATDYFFLPEDLEVSSLCAAHQIAMSAEDGRRWAPIGSALQVFTLPAAIWALSRSKSQDVGAMRTITWLSKLTDEFMEPLDKTIQALLARYLNAVGLTCPDTAIFAGLNTGDWAVCKTQWEPPSEWDVHETNYVVA